MTKDNMEQVWLNDKNHHIHPFTEFPTFKQKGSMIFTSGDKVHIQDSNGKRYLDGVGGMWCMNIGYGNQEMSQAIAEQTTALSYANPFIDQTTVPAANLAAKLAELAPGTLNHVFFSCGGSVANDTAIKMIYFYFSQQGKKSKKHIISRIDAYHGTTCMAMALTGSDYGEQGHCVGADIVHHLSCPNPYRRPDGQSLEQFCAEKVQELEDKILQLGADNVAAFFAEPIMGAGGVIVPPPGYHKKTLAICRKYDVLYVSDEVVTAFGRLGHMFASQPVFDIIPDIIVCAKGLTSGYLPLGATIVSAEIYDVISRSNGPSNSFCHGFTYSGHPVSCAAALKNIEIMERDKICQTVNELAPYFEEQLKTLCNLEIVGDVRGHKYMMCIENVRDKKSKQTFPDSAKIGERITEYCEQRGLIVRPLGHLNILSPPLILTKQDIDFIVLTLRQSITDVTRDLKAEGLL